MSKQDFLNMDAAQLANWRVVMTTTAGEMEMEFWPETAPGHVRNFLDCVKSRQQPVLNVERGHYVSTVAHLGNIAFRTGQKINWDAQTERVIGSPRGDDLVRVQYRSPWKLDYLEHT